MKNIIGIDQVGLGQELALPKYRINQIYRWIHKNQVHSFDEMTNLPIDVRQELSSKYVLSAPKVLQTAKSKDGSIKYLLVLDDGNKIETVHMPESKGRVTVCVSSQVGCPFACKFCATGKMGLIRNLSVSEILSQVYLSPIVTNIVFMGMGEPMLNFDNVLKAIHILNSEEGLNIGARKITVSTVGIPDGIRRFALEPIQIRLAVSLNSADDKTRSDIMPVNQKFPLSELKKALLDYQKKTGRRITLEYVMLNGVNDTPDSLRHLIAFCNGLDVNLNLIPYNVHDEIFKSSDRKIIASFIEILKSNNIEAVKRVSHGSDIAAACGQLAVYNS